MGGVSPSSPAYVVNSVVDFGFENLANSGVFFFVLPGLSFPHATFLHQFTPFFLLIASNLLHIQTKRLVHGC
jgi:hypothetical protein